MSACSHIEKMSYCNGWITLANEKNIWQTLGEVLPLCKKTSGFLFAIKSNNYQPDGYFLWIWFSTSCQRNQTRDGCVGSAIVTSVLCLPSIFVFPPKPLNWYILGLKHKKIIELCNPESSLACLFVIQLRNNSCLFLSKNDWVGVFLTESEINKSLTWFMISSTLIKCQ